MRESYRQGKQGGRASRLAMLLVVALASGCASKDPIFEYDSPAPAQVLATVENAGISDGRARFRQLFCDAFADIGPPEGGEPTCGAYLHRLVDEPGPAAAAAGDRLPIASVRFVVIPGYMGDAAPGGMRALGTGIDRLAGKGYRIEYLEVSGGGGGPYNADRIAEFFRARDFSGPDKLVLIGYSKGTIDILHFLVRYPELAARVDALVSYSGAVNGSALAEVFPQFIVDVAGFLGGSDAGDGEGFESLRPSVQMPWLAANPLPEHIAYYSLVAFTDRENVSSVLRNGYDILAQVTPRNDGQLIFYDQILPRSTLLGYANADHWAVALAFTYKAPTMASMAVTRNAFPREAMLEAVVLFLREDL